MVRHVAELSGGEAAAREKTAVMLAALEQVEAAFVAGDLGVDQTRLLARVYANKRVRFAMSGAQISEILDHYLQAERSIDWDKAVAEHGDDTCEDHMARTAAQQRANALRQVFLDAAANPDGSCVADFTTNIVMDQRTSEKMLARLLDPHPRVRDRPSQTARRWRVNQPRKRGTRLRMSQPNQARRLHRHPKPQQWPHPHTPRRLNPRPSCLSGACRHATPHPRH
ncbi:MAG: hypothetical protein P8L46_06700 [Acidimicrobiales bacterium]|nr:hypothetical protein [Acidimicrobiales bacterium]MDG2217719.1 hypothetical protein [Acidimicrobiales bacterium]